MAREVTEDPIRISVGTTGQANEDITQVIVVLDDEMLKWDWMMRLLPGFCAGKDSATWSRVEAWLMFVFLCRGECHCVCIAQRGC